MKPLKALYCLTLRPTTANLRSGARRMLTAKGKDVCPLPMRTKSGLEKRREEKKEEKKQTKSDAPPPAVLPDWLPLDSWQGYLDMRAKKRKPPTPHAVDLLLRQLSKMRDAGQNIAAVLDKSTVNGWTDVYEIKGGSGGAPAGEQQQFGAAGQATARAAQQWMENGNA